MKTIIAITLFLVLAVNQLSATIEDETFNPNHQRFIVKAYDTHLEQTVYDENPYFIYAGRDDGFPEDEYDNTRMVGYSCWFFNSSELAVDSIKIKITWEANKNIESNYWNEDSTGFRDDSLFIRAKAVPSEYYDYLSNEAKYDTIRSWEKYICMPLNENYNTSVYNPSVTDSIILGGDHELTQLVRDAIRDGKDLYFGYDLDPDSINNKYLGDGSVKLTVYYNEVTLANRYSGTSALLGDSLSVNHLTMNKYDFTVPSGEKVSAFVDDIYNVETHEQVFQSGNDTYQHHDWDYVEADYKLIRENYEMSSASEITAFFKDIYPVNLQSTTGTLYIKDPWYVNPSTGEQDNPYQTTTEYDLFFDQNNQFDPDKPSYLIKASAYTGGSGSYSVFHQWSTIGNTTFQSSTSPETKVCFKDTNTVSAEYYTGISVTDGTLGYDAGGYYVSYTEDRIYATSSGIYEVTGWQSSDNNKAQIGSGDEAKCYVTFSGSIVTLSPVSQQVNNQTDHFATIQSGETLSIPAGANISFASGFTINVVGAISALGTAANPISLTGTGKAASYDWLQFNPADTLIIVGSSQAELDLKHVNIEDVKCGVYFDGDDISAELNNVNFENTNVGIFIDRVVDNSIEIDSVVFADNDVHVSFSDGLAEDDQTSSIIISNCIFTGDCDYAIWGFPQDDLSSYNSNLDIFICNNVFYDDNDIYLHIVGGGDYGDIDIELYNNIFHSSYCSINDYYGIDVGCNIGYNTSTSNMGNDVITDDPLLIDPDTGDFRIAFNSPCVDTGADYFSCQYLPEYDPDGTIPDIGAHYFPQLDKSGTINSDETWYGGMTITGDVTVSSGVELTIDPGSKIMFNQGRGMKVYGTLTADGLSSAHIIFTRSDPSNNNKSFWDEITIESSGHYLLDYVEMYGSYLGFHPRNSSNHYIKNSHFEKNFVGVYPYNSDNTTIYNCDFIDNTYGTYNWSSSGLDINHCHYNNNSSYALYFNGSSGEVNKNTIENTSNYDGIMVSGGGDPDLSTVYDPYHVELNNSIEDNGRHGVNIYQGSYADLGTKLFTGTEIFGGFNYFDHGSGNYDVRNDNSYDIYAQVNWWEDMNVTSDVETDPTAEDLGYGLPKASNIDQPDYIDELFFQAYKLEKVDSNYTAAINVLNEIASEVPNDPRCKKAIIRLARLYHKLDDRAGFIENLDDIYDKYPEQCVGLAALDRSVSVWAKNREFEEALARAAELLDKYNSVGDYDQEISALLFKQAMIYQDMDSTANLSKPAKVLAEENFAKILSDYPESEQAHLIQELFNVQAPDKEIIDIPMEFALHPAYPNPFNPSTTIRFNLPEAAKVKIAVYDMLGREIWQQETMYRPGYHQIVWNGVNQANDPVASGVYLIQLTSKKYNATIKVLLFK